MKPIIISETGDLDRAAAEFLEMTAGAAHIAFYAGMGVGKTTFITALCRALGVSDLVTSPTFTIVNEYKDGSGNPVYHFDLYRINKPEELYDIGFEEYMDSGDLCLIEWPELAEDMLPDDTLRFRIEMAEDGSRVVTLM